MGYRQTCMLPHSEAFANMWTFSWESQCQILPARRASKTVYTSTDRLVGLVVKVYASRAEDPGFKSRLRRDFSGVESYQ